MSNTHPNLREISLERKLRYVLGIKIHSIFRSLIFFANLQNSIFKLTIKNDGTHFYRTEFSSRNVKSSINNVKDYIIKRCSGLKLFTYKLKLIFLSGTCLLILLKYMENLEYSGQKKLRKSILACIQ